MAPMHCSYPKSHLAYLFSDLTNIQTHLQLHMIKWKLLTENPQWEHSWHFSTASCWNNEWMIWIKPLAHPEVQLQTCSKRLRGLNTDLLSDREHTSSRHLQDITHVYTIWPLPDPEPRVFSDTVTDCPDYDFIGQIKIDKSENKH